MKQQLPVYQADWRGEGHFYTNEDLEWAVEPTDDDPGVTTPKAGAVPRFADGMPVAKDEP